jgi:hemoglobin
MENRKKQDAEAIGINADYISAFVERFYGHIRDDKMLGPIFAERVTNWPVHLDRMKSFWRSILHNSGEFSGNPMMKHMAIPGLGAEHFAHWLDLFNQTLRELETHPEATKQVGERAKAIADKLLGGIRSKNQGLNIISGSRTDER